MRHHLSHMKVMEDNINNPLTLVAAQPSTLSMNKNGSIDINTIQYRKNNTYNWTDYTLGDQISLNVGQCIQFQNLSNTLSISDNDFINFNITGEMMAYNNIQSLVNYSQNAPQYCFRKLFQNCTALTRAPLLPAKTVGTRAYASLFGKTSVSNKVKMQATSLGQYACFYMFEQAPIISAPEIHATTLNLYCCRYMFYNCKQLINPPSILPATTLANYCYSNMFENCSALTSVPILSATTIASYCYSNMFHSCTSLTNVPNDYLPVTNLKNNCYSSMFNGCRHLLNAPELPATTLTNACYNQMFSGCGEINEIKVYFTEWVNGCTNYWLSAVSNKGTFICPNGLDVTRRDESHIPTSWNIYHPIF